MTIRIDWIGAADVFSEGSEYVFRLGNAHSVGSRYARLEGYRGK